MLDGLGAVLGAGVLVAIAPAAAVSGSWLPVAAVLAVLAGVTGGVATQAPTPPALRAVAIPAAAVAAGVAARALGGYLLPQHPLYPAIAGLALAALAGALPVVVPWQVRRWAGLFVLAVLLVVVLACYAIAPPGNPPVPAWLPGAGDPGGLLAAAAVLSFAFGGMPAARRRSTGWLLPAAAGVVLVLLALATLRQLGAGRLAVSPLPVADALAAAGGTAVAGLVVAAAAVALLSVTSAAATAAVAALTSAGVPVAAGVAGWAVVAVVVAWLLPVPLGFAVAAGCLLLHWLACHVALLTRARSHRSRAVAAAGALLSAALLVSLPVGALAIAAGVTAATVLVVTLVRRAPGR